MIIQDTGMDPVAHHAGVSGICRRAPDCFSAAAAPAEVLDSFFGTNTAFSATSPSLPGVTMSFSSFDAAAQAAGEKPASMAASISSSRSMPAMRSGWRWATGRWPRFQPSPQDSVPPKIVLAQNSGLVTDNNPVITGNVTDNLSGVASLTVSIDGGAPADVTFDAAGAFSVPVNLPANVSSDGAHQLAFIATDAAGNVSDPLDFSFVLDTATPVIGLAGDSVQDGGTLAAGALLDGTVTTGGSAGLVALSYQFDGGTPMPVGFDAGGAFDQTLELGGLATGAHTLVVSATDAAGNSASDTLDVMLPVLPPLTIAALTPTAGASDIGA